MSGPNPWRELALADAALARSVALGRLAPHDHMAVPDHLRKPYDWREDEQLTDPMAFCHHCGQRTRIMINCGTGVCSENCRKALADE